MAENVLAHSDDEEIPGENSSAIKTLQYRSKNSGKFWSLVDVERIKEAQIAAPTDFPLDFYDADWFNGLQPGQKRLVAKVDQVAFLPDASKSLLPVRHPDEKLGDRAFNSKYYDIISEPYDLDLGEEETMEDDDEESGESLGSRDTRYEDKSDDAEEEDSDYYAEGETGDLYDDAGKPEGVVDMGAKGKGKAKDVSPEPEDKDGSESMED